MTLTPEARPTVRREHGLTRWVANLRTSVKISAIVAVLAVAAITVGVIATTSLAGVYAKGKAVQTNSMQPATDLADLRDQVMQSRLSLRDAVLAVDLNSTKAAETKMRAADAAVDSELARYLPESADQAVVRQFQTLWAQYKQARDAKLVPAAEANDTAAYVRLAASDVTPIAVQALAQLDQAKAAEEAEATHTVAEAKNSYTGARTLVLVILTIGVLAGLLLAGYVTRMIVRPLGRVSALLDAVAAGDLTQSAGVTSTDEIARMAQALDAANARTRAVIRAFTSTSHALATSAEQLSATSSQIAAAADQASDEANLVSAAAEEVSSNVQTVAASSEEMGASINEIAHNAAEAARIAANAVQGAEAANATVSKLGESSQQVGNVIKVITSIAEQTNLLALNATIEAARAGDAGKGFAVVASEVKDLAQETAKATDDIAGRIAAIQSDIASAVAAIGDISSVINKIDEYQTTIAAAVEEQTVTTQEIGRNIGEAATGAGTIAENITGVATATRATTEGVSQSQQAASELARMSAELRQLAGQFTA